MPTLFRTFPNYLSYIIESSYDAIIGTNLLEGYIISWNKGAENLYGYKAEEALGQHISFIIPPDIQIKEQKEVHAKIELGESIVNYETERVGKNGIRIFVLLTASPIFNDQGQFLGVSGITKNLTEQKRLELLLNTKISELESINLKLKEQSKKLEEAQVFYRDFYENAPDMFLSIDYENAPDMLSFKRKPLKITKCNKKLVDTLGYTKEEILTMVPDDLYHPSCLKSIQKGREELLKKGFIIEHEQALKTKSGKMISVSVSGAVIRNDEGYVVGCNILWKNITALVKARRIAENREIVLKKTVSLLNRMNKDLDSFIYMASHDLRTPLRAIHSLLQVVEGELKESLPISLRVIFKEIKQKASRMSGFINDILTYYQSGSENALPSKIDLVVLIQEVISLLEVPNGFIFLFSSTIPPFYTFKIPLYQVFHNLLSNCIKYHDKPEQGRVLISCKDMGDYWEFSVNDNGPGIAEKYHEKIFGLFEKLESKDMVEGSGLGLALIKKLVEKYGQTITVTSVIGEGSTFTFKWNKSFPPLEET